MRFVPTSFALLSFVVLSTLAGCAAPYGATRGNDTAVRAETRRFSRVLDTAGKVHDGPSGAYRPVGAL